MLENEGYGKVCLFHDIPFVMIRPLNRSKGDDTLNRQLTSSDA